ncbi:MAG TPA: PspC domain-containing protein [Streptosporangiaceae bacterium]|jgi:phage shock protein PspC (stress-responsive transcriptional regulator)
MDENNSPKQLRRSRTTRMVAGVCGGIAEYFGVDANLVRLVIVVLTFFGGTGALIYVIGWLLVPEADADNSIAENLINQAQNRDR